MTARVAERRTDLNTRAVGRPVKLAQVVPYDINGRPTGATSAPVTANAGEALSGHRGVYVAADGLAYYADPANETGRLLSGITTGAAALGASASIQTDGAVDEPSWAWTAGGGPVWLGTAGALTQTVPVAGLLIQVGIPMGPTRLRIEPQVVARV